MALLCGVLFCGCKKDKDEANKYPSYDKVAQMLPGVWECVDSYIPEDEGYILEFVSSRNGSGTCYINETPYDWQLEPVYKEDFTDNVTGCALALVIGGRYNWYFVYSISDSKMEWRNIGSNWNESIGNEAVLFERR